MRRLQRFMRLPPRLLVSIPALLLALGSGCTDDQATPAPDATRPFAMGFTYFPPDATPAGVQRALEIIRTDGDMLVAHFDAGIPWDAALANDYDRYPADLRNEIAYITSWRPATHRLYVAFTPIAFLRDRLAPTRGENGAQTFQHPWDTLAFDHPDVVRAYTNHCRMMIDRFRPDWFTFGIEVNLLRFYAPDSTWNRYVALAASVYGNLRTAYPSLPLLQTVAVEAFYLDPPRQEPAVAAVFSSTDYVAVSTYPFADAGRYPSGSAADPGRTPADHLSRMAALAPGKPFAVGETCWPAEDLGRPYPVTLTASAEYQRAYAERLLAQCATLDARFVNWFITQDYDELWRTVLVQRPDSAITRIWRDTGLYDGNGAARPSLAAWRAALSRPRR